MGFHTLGPDTSPLLFSGAQAQDLPVLRHTDISIAVILSPIFTGAALVFQRADAQNFSNHINRMVGTGGN